MTQIDTLLDNFVEFVERELATIATRAFDSGYECGYEMGLAHRRQSNIENEYYAYCEGRQYGYIKGFWEGKQHAELPNFENEYHAYCEGYHDGYRAGYDDGDHEDFYDDSIVNS